MDSPTVSFARRKSHSNNAALSQADISEEQHLTTKYIVARGLQFAEAASAAFSKRGPEDNTNLLFGEEKAEGSIYHYCRKRLHYTYKLSLESFIEGRTKSRWTPLPADFDPCDYLKKNEFFCGPLTPEEHRRQSIRGQSIPDPSSPMSSTPTRGRGRRSQTKSKSPIRPTHVRNNLKPEGILRNEEIPEAERYVLMC